MLILNQNIADSKSLLTVVQIEVKKIINLFYKLNEKDRLIAIQFILTSLAQFDEYRYAYALAKSRAVYGNNYDNNLLCCRGHIKEGPVKIKPFYKRKILINLSDEKFCNELEILKLNNCLNRKIVSDFNCWYVGRRNFYNFIKDLNILCNFIRLGLSSSIHKSICSRINLYNKQLLSNSYSIQSVIQNGSFYIQFNNLEYPDNNFSSTTSSSSLSDDNNDDLKDNPPPLKKLKTNNNEHVKEKQPKIKRIKKISFDCLHCNKTYKKRKSLINHYHNHPGYCPDCGDLQGTLPHQKAEHNRLFHKDEYPYVCDTCGDSFARNQQYQVHIDWHQKTLNNSKSKNQKKTSEKVSRYFKELPEGTVCHICGKVFNNKMKLALHIQRVHPPKEKIIVCTYCPKVFKMKTNYDRHVALHTKTEKSYICEQCGSAYYTQGALNDHVLYMHTEKKEFVCDICNKEFAVKRALNRHRQLHSDERPFTCNLCPQAFKLKANLVRHKQGVHNKAPQDKKVIKYRNNDKGEIEPVEPVKPQKSKKRAKSQQQQQQQQSPQQPQQSQQQQSQQQQPDATTSMVSYSSETFDEIPATTKTTILQMISNQMPIKQQPDHSTYLTVPYNNTLQTNIVPVDSNNHHNVYSHTSQVQHMNMPMEDHLMNYHSSQGQQMKYEYAGGSNSGGYNRHQNNQNYLGHNAGYNNLQQTLIEINPDNMQSQIVDITNTDLLQYQNMWNTNVNQFDYSGNIDQHNSQVNTYNNIGSILTNLELIDNNTGFDNNFEIVTTKIDHPHPQHHQHHHQQHPQHHQSADKDINYLNMPEADVMHHPHHPQQHHHQQQHHQSQQHHHQPHHQQQQSHHHQHQHQHQHQQQHLQQQHFNLSDYTNTGIDQQHRTNNCMAPMEQHYDFNGQNHTLTDISNTFLKDNHRGENSQIMNNYVGLEAVNNQQSHNMNMTHHNTNVMLPSSLVDYLQHPFQS